MELNITKNYKNHLDRLEKLLIKDNHIEKSLVERGSDELLNIILNYDRSEDWKEQKIYTLSHYYNSIGKSDDYERFYKLGKEYTAKRSKKEKENIQSEKEKKYYMSQLELSEIKKCYENYGKNLDLMNSFLLLCLLTEQPTLRTSTYHTMIIIDDMKNINKNYNYVYIKKSSDSFAGKFIINNDKHSNNTHVKKKRKIDESEEEKDDSEIEISPDLAKKIYESWVIFPREKLFFNIDTNSQMLELLRKTTKNEGITFNMCRSSYKTHQHVLDPHMSYDKKEKLSKMMRHTTTTADINYFKSDLAKDYNESDLKNKGVKIANQICETIDKDKLSNKTLNSLKLQLDEYKNTYEFKKKRNDVIRYANKNNTKIKDSTVEKYSILFDGEKYY
jgi:hypothetical protein